MLARHAIEAFINKPADNFNWLKDLPIADLDDQLDALDPKPVFSTELLKHQKVSFLLGLSQLRFFLQLDMGLGKSLISLELINYLLKVNPDQLFIVFAPTDEVVLGWVDEIEKWKLAIPYHLLIGTRQEKWDVLESAKTGILLGTYVGIATMVSELVRIKNSKKREWQPNKGFLNQLTSKLNGLVMDESTKVASTKSLSYEVVNEISKAVKIRYALAGRPFGRDPMDLWAQFYLVDRGETLSPTLGLYRSAFFHKKANYWGGPYSFDYQFNKSMTKELARLTAHRSIVYSADECDKLPDLIRITKRVNFPKENEEYYQQVVQSMIAAKGNFREIKNGFLRLRQLSSGFIGLIDDDDGERVEIVFESNPKLDLLLQLVDEMPTDRKMVVFHDFNVSGQMISDALRVKKIQHGRLWGGTTDWERIKKDFNSKKDFRVLVVNSRKGSYGLNLQNANYCVFFESPVSSIDRAQAQKRCHRQGQKHTVFVIDLVTRGTMDERILQFIEEGTDLFNSICSDPTKFLL